MLVLVYAPVKQVSTTFSQVELQAELSVSHALEIFVQLVANLLLPNATLVLLELHLTHLWTVNVPPATSKTTELAARVQ